MLKTDPGHQELPDKLVFGEHLLSQKALVLKEIETRMLIFCSADFIFYIL